MECEKIRELLPLYSEKMLNEAEMKVVSEHLKNCPECLEELTFINGIINGVQSLEEIEPSEKFKCELKNKLLNEKRKKVLFTAKNLKRIYALAASAAVILLSVVALNTEFYKINSDDILNGSKKENEQFDAEYSQNPQIENNNDEAEETEQNFLGKAIENNSETVKKPRSENNIKNTAENPQKNVEKDVKTEEKTEQNTENTEKAPEKQASSDFSQQTAEIDENAKQSEIALFSEEETEKNPPARIASGGGSSSRAARKKADESENEKSAATSAFSSYEKITFHAVPNNESYKEALKDYTPENGIYKLPIEVFYNKINELTSNGAVGGYYTTESFAEEYESLKKSGNNAARILEIEEICKFGYIVIE